MNLEDPVTLLRMQTPDREARRQRSVPHAAVLVLLLVLAPSGPLMGQTEGRAALDAFWSGTLPAAPSSSLHSIYGASNAADRLVGACTYAALFPEDA